MPRYCMSRQGILLVGKRSEVGEVGKGIYAAVDMRGRSDAG